MTHEPRWITGVDRTWALQPSSPEDPAVRLWTTTRTPFETDQSAEQKRMVSAVGHALGELRFSAGTGLRAVFVCDQVTGRQPDAENITLYNFRSALSSVAQLTTVSFERSFAAASPCPMTLAAPPPYHHVWDAACHEQPSKTWTAAGPELAKWRDVPCAVVTGENAGRNVWLSMREHSELVERRAARYAGSYGIQITVRFPRGARPGQAISALKGCLDGCIASLQDFAASDQSTAEQVMTKHARWPHWQRSPTLERLLELSKAGDQPPVFMGSPFNLNGLSPADDRCVTGQLRVEELTSGSTPTVSGSIYSAQPASRPGFAYALTPAP